MSSGFKIICRFDEALDAEAMGPEAVRTFRETGDFGSAKIREGHEPVVFHCRRLKVSEMQSVTSHTTEVEARTAAFARGLMSVDGRYADGGGRQSWTRPDPSRPITSNELDACFDFAEVQEVGAAIYGRSLLGKGRPVAWPLPDTSRDAVGALVSRLVGQTLAKAAMSPPSKPEADPPAQPEHD